MTSIIQPSTQSSSLSSLSFQPDGLTKTVLPLLSPQQIHSSRNTRHVISCNHSCHKSSINESLQNNMTHLHVVNHHLSRKPEATPTNIPKALLLSPPLPIRQRPANAVTSHGYVKGLHSRSLSSDHCERNHSTSDDSYPTKISFQSYNPIRNKLTTKSQSRSMKLNKSSPFTTENGRNRYHHHQQQQQPVHIVNQFNKEEFSHLPIGFRWNYIFLKLSNWFQRIQTTNYSRTSSSDRTSSSSMSTYNNNADNNNNNNNNKFPSRSNLHCNQLKRHDEYIRSQSQPVEKSHKIKSNLYNHENVLNNSKIKSPLSNEMQHFKQNISLSDFEQINNSIEENIPSSSSSAISTQFPVICSNDSSPIIHTTNKNINRTNCNLFSSCQNNNSCSCSDISFNNLSYTNSHEISSNCLCSQSCPIKNSHQLNEFQFDKYQISSTTSCLSDCCFCQRYLNYCEHCQLVPYSFTNQYRQNDQTVQSSHCHNSPKPHYHHYYYSCQHHHHLHHHHHHHHNHHRQPQHHLNPNSNQCHHMKFPSTNPITTNANCINYSTQRKASRNFHLNLDNQYATIGQLGQWTSDQSDCLKISPSFNKPTTATTITTDCSSPVITLQCLNLSEKQFTRLDDHIDNVTTNEENNIDNNSIDNEYTMNTRNISSAHFIDYYHQNHEHEVVVERMNADDNVVECVGSTGSTCSDLVNGEKVQCVNIPKIDNTTITTHTTTTTNNTFVNQKFVTDLMLLKRIGWYWGPLTVEEAELLLKNCSDGTFLVRDSSHDSYILSVSFRSGGQIYHTRIEHLAGKFSLALLNDLNDNVSSSVAECIERVMIDSFQDRMHFLPILDDTSPSNPSVQFMNNHHPHPHQHEQSQQIDHTLEHLQSTRRSTSITHIKASLLHPLSRFLIVPSLVHLCRFELLLHVRYDHIDLLPLPLHIIRYLKESQYYAEFIPAYLELLANMNNNNNNDTQQIQS
ncbi:unnamed protein product [Schistosoma turkestanicum]|nr:unnamed protein product [Schistosoma turkestanicum]